MTEAALSRLICDLAHSLGWSVFRLPVNRTVRPVKDAVGYPDLTLARDGEVLWLELKGSRGEMSPAQWGWWHALQPRYHIITPDQWESGRVGELLA